MSSVALSGLRPVARWNTPPIKLMSSVVPAPTDGGGDPVISARRSTGLGSPADSGDTLTAERTASTDAEAARAH